MPTRGVHCPRSYAEFRSGFLMMKRAWTLWTGALQPPSRPYPRDASAERELPLLGDAANDVPRSAAFLHGTHARGQRMHDPFLERPRSETVPGPAQGHSVGHPAPVLRRFRQPPQPSPLV